MRHILTVAELIDLHFNKALPCAFTGKHSLFQLLHIDA